MAKKFFFTFLINLLLICCKNTSEYAKIYNVNNKWIKNDTLNFNFTIKDSSKHNRISLVLRNNNEYKFSNIYLFIKIKERNKTLVTDTLNYRLADNSGKWLGSGIGSVKEIYLEYKKNYQFPKKGNYILSITQGMREDTLRGIEDIGINIE